jgi:hypothetical protein
LRDVPNDVRMIQSAQDAGLVKEPARVVTLIVAEELDGNDAILRDVMRTENDAHTAGTSTFVQDKPVVNYIPNTHGGHIPMQGKCSKPVS